VVAFGKTGELAAQFLKKGRRVFVQGMIRNRLWEDKDGVKRFRTEVVAEWIQFGSKAEKKDEPVEESVADPAEAPLSAEPIVAVWGREGVWRGDKGVPLVVPRAVVALAWPALAGQPAACNFVAHLLDAGGPRRRSWAARERGPQSPPAFAQGWSDLLELTLVPVLEDQELVEVLRRTRPG
jgi:hypothetical protein